MDLFLGSVGWEREGGGFFDEASDVVWRCFNWNSKVNKGWVRL